jgi:hypothetical protein
LIKAVALVKFFFDPQREFLYIHSDKKQAVITHGWRFDPGFISSWIVEHNREPAKL